MKKLLLILIVLLVSTICYAADKVEITVKEYTIKNETPSVEKENKKYTADIYIGGNLLVAGLEVTSKETAKVECEAWLKKYNNDNGTNKSTTIGNMTIEVK